MSQRRSTGVHDGRAWSWLGQIHPHSSPPRWSPRRREGAPAAERVRSLLHSCLPCRPRPCHGVRVLGEPSTPAQVHCPWLIPGMWRCSHTCTHVCTMPSHTCTHNALTHMQTCGHVCAHTQVAGHCAAFPPRKQAVPFIVWVQNTQKTGRISTFCHQRASLPEAEARLGPRDPDGTAMTMTMTGMQRAAPDGDKSQAPRPLVGTLLRAASGKPVFTQTERRGSEDATTGREPLGRN